MPRNPEIADNRDPAYFDLGVCAQEGLIDKVPARVEARQAFVDGLCGAFRGPTLRNVARTAPYMHNGYFKTLRQVLEFYVTRERQPERWYPRGPDGSVRKYDDLPAKYVGNVNTSEAPYAPPHTSEAARLSSAEIDDLLAFLATLTDGYAPPARSKAELSQKRNRDSTGGR